MVWRLDYKNRSHNAYLYFPNRHVFLSRPVLEAFPLLHVCHSYFDAHADAQPKVGTGRDVPWGMGRQRRVREQATAVATLVERSQGRAAVTVTVGVPTAGGLGYG